ncbi:MAG TPA: glycoside hydrolase family 28 protein [Rhizomicrobium sp.]|nr:glycoside hydrolase family 28 protein [Rhizomicrobium sp.]
MTRICALGLVFVALSAGAATAATCDPAQYGARADGVTKDTRAIQQAIDACAAQGGGTVTLTHGTYVSAPIVLKSNVTLDVAAGATLLGSPDHDDYPAMTVFREPGRQSLISAVNAHDIAITGQGTIDGNGKSWWKDASGKRPSGVMGEVVFRPRLIVFDHSRHIRMSGVTVQNSPSWQIIPYYSDDVIISHVKVLAPADSPNTDAIDPFAANHVTIDHVTADVGDDNIAIKSGAINSPGPDDPSRDITITDCTFLHGHGLSVGSELAGGAQNVRAERITFNGTDQGIRIKANRARGHDVSHLSFKDITMTGVKTAILISEYYPNVEPPAANAPAPIGRLTPFFHDFTIENVTATGSKVAAVVYGLPESPVKGLVLRHVHLSADKGMVISDAEARLEDVKVTAAQGQAIDIRPSAKVTMH